MFLRKNTLQIVVLLVMFCTYFLLIRQVRIPEELIPIAEQHLSHANRVPKFIISITYEPYLSSDRSIFDFNDYVCVNPDLGELWELGDSGATLLSTVYHQTTFTIDGINISPQSLQIIRFGPEMTKFDEKGNVLVSYGFPEICAIIPLAYGLHLVDYQMTTSSGRILSYSWAFEKKP
ncbi:MAG: hypothetical protein U0528_18110 [Anaerolineae bacterium]